MFCFKWNYGTFYRQKYLGVFGIFAKHGPNIIWIKLRIFNFYQKSFTVHLTLLKKKSKQWFYINFANFKYPNMVHKFIFNYINVYIECQKFPCGA